MSESADAPSDAVDAASSVDQPADAPMDSQKRQSIDALKGDLKRRCLVHSGNSLARLTELKDHPEVGHLKTPASSKWVKKFIGAMQVHAVVLPSGDLLRTPSGEYPYSKSRNFPGKNHRVYFTSSPPSDHPEMRAASVSNGTLVSNVRSTDAISIPFNRRHRPRSLVSTQRFDTRLSLATVTINPYQNSGVRMMPTRWRRSSSHWDIMSKMCPMPLPRKWTTRFAIFFIFVLYRCPIL